MVSVWLSKTHPASNANTLEEGKGSARLGTGRAVTLGWANRAIVPGEVDKFTSPHPAASLIYKWGN